MCDTFISMLRDIDLLYGFIHECAYLINNLYEDNNYDHLVKKLCNKFVLPIINIIKDKHKKEYNTHVKDTKDVDNICLYLMSICAEKYFKLTQDEYLKIKKFIDNNIDTVEAMLMRMHEFFDLSKKCYDSYCYCPCNCYCKQSNRIYLTDKYIEFCKENSIIVKNITKSCLNVEYIKYLYLLQKAADQIISKKLNLYDENTCIREIDTLINIFIILYNNSNIDCNEKVESKIYNLYQHYTY